MSVSSQREEYPNGKTGEFKQFFQCIRTSQFSSTSKEPWILFRAAISLGIPWHAGAQQEFLKCVIPDYLVRDTDLFSLRLSNKRITTANITKLHLFLVRSAKNVFQNFSN